MEHICKKEEILNIMKKDIDNLYDTKDVVTELKVLINILVEHSKKQDEISKQQSETMIKISNTVEQQGILLTQLADQQNEIMKKGSIEYMTIFQMILFKVIPPIIIAGLTYLVLQVVNK